MYSQRDEVWQQITDKTWDVVVIGGGITGAGILREAARRGLNVLLVEMKDFAWGTSSRSSKMVHGGLRYLATGQIGLTLESVRERQQLLADAPGLIDPLGFLIATREGDHPGKLTFSMGLMVYDLMALQWSHQYYSPEEFRMLAPHISDEGLQGGFRYTDAQTDDARLVLRVMQEALADGGTALNYVKAEEIICENEVTTGVRLHNMINGEHADVKARLVINATGAWVDKLRGQVGGAAKMRPLRGSHLVFPAWRFPVAQAVSFLHPHDSRPVFAFPWEGATLVGTTDFDHDSDLYAEPRISADEVAYLMAGLASQFPALELTLDDVLTTWAGVRPVVGSGKEDPSKESRDYVIWQEKGLLTVTGGKLTTFRVVALAALKAAREFLPELRDLDSKSPVLNQVDDVLEDVRDDVLRKRLVGRYGSQARKVIEAAQADELAVIAGTFTRWVELRWAARTEGVMHLEDLLLRRTRLGFLLKNGGLDYIERIREICQPELGWSDERWQQEAADYRTLWQTHYSVPTHVPDWTSYAG